MVKGKWNSFPTDPLPLKKCVWKLNSVHSYKLKVVKEKLKNETITSLISRFLNIGVLKILSGVSLHLIKLIIALLQTPQVLHLFIPLGAKLVICTYINKNFLKLSYLPTWTIFWNRMMCCLKKGRWEFVQTWQRSSKAHVCRNNLLQKE